ncbi:NHERF family PDZ scaffold protein 2 [Brachyhypopomus gauderio]|uniref:NHERF family PDZ scaffold protein 2 n=1 Tax=Brachyhypopomus gauderio TaxID=698409 RepID=UPI00404374C4
MAYSLERDMFERGLRPRLCYLTKGERGYGFHLHGERNSGAQYIRKIEPGSPADLAGLRSGDRVVEVNGENVEKDSHCQVVEKIMAVDHRTRLLVVDGATEDVLRLHGLPCTEELAVEMGCLSTRSSSLASSPITSCSSPPHRSLSPSPRDSITLPFFRTSRDKPRTPNTTPQVDRLPLVANGNKEVLEVTEVEDVMQMEMTGGEAARDLRPRLCRITIGERGYGFNLHCDKTRAGQFVRSVDAGSPAERAGLQTGDRIVEVNGRSIKGLRHSQVVALIKEGGGQTQLLVVDPETDTLFHRLGITPTAAHLKEDCVDGPLIEGPVSNYPITDSSASPSPIRVGSPVSPPTLHITLKDPPITNGSLKHQSHGSSSSHSTLSEMETSSSDPGNKMFSSDHHKRHSAPAGKQEVKRAAEPARESGLHLSPTAAEARRKARAKRDNRRAPPMDWSKKHEIFSNF